MEQYLGHPGITSIPPAAFQRKSPTVHAQKVALEELHPAIRMSVIEAHRLMRRLELSPRPWKAMIGRVGGQGERIDIYDSKGERLCHFHHVEPRGEATPNWGPMADFIVNAPQVIEKLLGEIDRLNKEK